MDRYTTNRQRNCRRCQGYGLPEVSHRDGGMCYRCGAIPTYRAGDDTDELPPITYWEARERYGYVVDVLTWYMHNGADAGTKCLAGEMVDLIRCQVTTEIDVMWRAAYKARDAHHGRPVQCIEVAR